MNPTKQQIRDARVYNLGDDWRNDRNKRRLRCGLGAERNQHKRGEGEQTNMIGHRVKGMIRRYPKLRNTATYIVSQL